MNDKQMMHGYDWQGQDLAGWYISEKLHGCRAYWDGVALWTRGGNAIAIPSAWRHALPAIALDCELWAGRNGFTAARLACQFGRFAPAVRLMVFDAAIPGKFLERQRALHQALAGIPFAEAVAHRMCRSTAHALSMMQSIQAIGGEGVMARHPENRYRPGRTREVLKLKETVDMTGPADPGSAGTGRTKVPPCWPQQPEWRSHHG